MLLRKILVVKKTVLALALVFTLPILMSTQFASAAHTAPDVHLTGNCITSPSDVYGAAPNQNNPLLRDTELYVSDTHTRFFLYLTNCAFF